MHPPRLSAVQKECLETGEFLCCHIVIDRAIHHMPRLLWLLEAAKPSQNWIKWLAESVGRAPIPRIHLMDSHHSPLVILQWKKRWPASSCWQPQRGHIISWIGMLLLDKFPLVGSLSKNNLQEKTAARGGIFKCQRIWKFLFISVKENPLKNQLLCQWDAIK